MSNTINVNKVSVPQTVGQTEEPQKQHHGARKTTSALFAQSSFQQVAGATLAGGVALPSLSQDQQQQINSLFGGLSDDGQKKDSGRQRPAGREHLAGHWRHLPAGGRRQPDAR